MWPQTLYVRYYTMGMQRRSTVLDQGERRNFVVMCRHNGHLTEHTDCIPYLLMSRRLMFTSYVVMTSQLECGVDSMSFTPMTSPVLRYCFFSPHIHRMNGNVNSTDECSSVTVTVTVFFHLQHFNRLFNRWHTTHCRRYFSSTQLSDFAFALPLPSNAISQDDWTYLPWRS